ncbi:MAG TPA: VIT and VWA domain-containing protein, partial [Chitinivibrionales bacterium]
MKRISCLVLLIGLMYSSSFAVGALYARRAQSSDNAIPLWLEKYDASVTITDQMAVTHVDQTFKNETSNRLEGIFIFPLPENAIVTELALWINGVRVVGSVMANDTAQAKYDSIVRKKLDPALLQYLGNNVFKLSVFPIEPVGNAMCERRIEVTYAELIPYNTGTVEYTFYMKTINLTPKPVQRTSCVFDWTSQKKIVSFSSPTHDNSSGLSIVKSSDTHYSGVLGNENTQSEKDLKLDCSFQNDSYALNHLTYTPRTDSLKMFYDSLGDNPYFLLWITPPDTAKPLKKNVCFVADISSSMTGIRITQLKQSLKAMVSMLAPMDMFNIIAFSTSIQPLNNGLIKADSANKALAISFINQLTEMGLTDMEDALKTAFKTSAWDDSSANALVFLTDGKATWPVSTSSAKIIDSVKTYNIKQTSVFTFGIGNDLDSGFLKLLAKVNSGFSTLIAADDSISSIMNSFMHKISYPLIKNNTVNFGALETFDVLPNPLPNVYSGTQVTILGRYKGTSTATITFKGLRALDTVVLQQNLAFPASTSHPFVPRMWASSKINTLLDQIAMYGQQAELVNQVKLLGKKYAIITPYTSMLVI